METIYGSVVLRPTRVGFLVRPNQENFSTVRQIIRLCTCLWGGAFNPIIPVCRTLPSAWKQDPYKQVTASGLADAYTKFFEPDVFVEAESGLAKELGIIESKRFFAQRVVSLKQFYSGDERRRADVTFGLSSLDIYKELYQKEFKFVSRDSRKVAIFKDDHPFCEAVFGAFPQDKNLAYLKKRFVDVCRPEEFSATAKDCLRKWARPSACW